MAIRKNKFISILIRDHLITAVEFSFQFGKITLEGYIDQDLPPGLVKNGEILQPEQLQKLIGQIFAHSYPHTFTATNIILALNDQLTFQHIFEFAKELSQKELENIIPIEAENVIPFTAEDIYWDYSIQNQKKGKQKVQFLAVPKTIADSYIKLFQNLGKEVIILTNFAEVYKSILQSSPEISKNGNVLIIEFNHYKTYFHLFQDNILIETKTAEIGLETLLEEWAELNSIDVNTLNDLLSTHNTDVLKPINLDKHFENYKEAFEPICNELCKTHQIKEIYYWGFAIRVPGFIEHLNKRLKLNFKLKVLWKPVKLNKFFQSNKKVVMEINKNITDFGLVIAAGHNFVSKMVSFKVLNLLPSVLRKKAKTLLLFNVFYRMSILIITLSVALTFYTGYSLTSNYLELLNLEKQTNNFEKLIYGQRYEEIRQDITSFNSTVDQLYTLSNQLHNVPKSYKEIATLQFDGVSVTSLNYERLSNEIVIMGVAENRQSLLDYQEELRTIAQPQELESPLSNFNDSENISFQIILKLAKPTQ